MQEFTLKLPGVYAAKFYLTIHRIGQKVAVVIHQHEIESWDDVINMPHHYATEAMASAPELRDLHPLNDIDWYCSPWFATLQHMHHGERHYESRSIEEHYAGKSPHGRMLYALEFTTYPVTGPMQALGYKHGLALVEMTGADNSAYVALDEFEEAAREEGHPLPSRDEAFAAANRHMLAPRGDFG